MDQWPLRRAHEAAELWTAGRRVPVARPRIGRLKRHRESWGVL